MPQPTCVALSVMFNNEATIEGMIRSIAANAGRFAEIVLVDNGSTDATVAVAERALLAHDLPGRVVVSTNTGFAGGYETARRSVTQTGPLLCINPDVELAPGTVGRLIEAAGLPGVAIATAPLNNLDQVEDSASRRRLPTLRGASAYALLGKLLPKRMRYNALDANVLAMGPRLQDGTPTTTIQATTGALMMLSPQFRTRESTIFDLDYWMYGEDLQLCLDAARLDLTVLMVETAPSIHVKGASSGWPRSRASDRAFHDALFIYYSKNLRRHALEQAVVRVAIELRFVQSRLRSRLARKQSA